MASAFCGVAGGNGEGDGDKLGEGAAADGAGEADTEGGEEGAGVPDALAPSVFPPQPESRTAAAAASPMDWSA
ncbi:hypothetical protein [Paenibacillus sp. RU4T]|uniref:hypothetical protein n=1 Tax=unclassified Paenibacillus TaxID=185978 RepID=UPI002E14FEE7